MSSARRTGLSRLWQYRPPQRRKVWLPLLAAILQAALNVAVWLIVADGVDNGIRAGDRDLVFQPFQRVVDHQADGGVGLGLAIARGFLDAMGGELTIEDTPGGGTTMVVGLPAAAPVRS